MSHAFVAGWLKDGGRRVAMILKSTAALGERKVLVWKFMRLFVPSKTRWFFEGHPKLDGQLWFQDRKLIYSTVRETKPLHCFEIGTWKGGGSTLFITQALYENRRGKLHTAEVNPDFWNAARANYQTYLPQLSQYVDFHLGDYNQIYPEILRSVGRVDLLFLDGPEDAQETLNQYEFFLPYMKEGSLLLVHDWFTEKTRLLKSYIENGKAWKIQKILTYPQSVGFALAVRT